MSASAAERPYRLGRYQAHGMAQPDDVLVVVLGPISSISRWSAWLIEAHGTMRHATADNTAEFRPDDGDSIRIEQIGRWDADDYLLCRGAQADALRVLYHHNQIDAFKNMVARIIEESTP